MAMNKGIRARKGRRWRMGKQQHGLDSIRLNLDSNTRFELLGVCPVWGFGCGFCFGVSDGCVGGYAVCCWSCELV
ncbi:hypothetical protein LINPERHAP2_LOCUS33090 [Linum perenne]